MVNVVREFREVAVALSGEALAAEAGVALAIVASLEEETGPTVDDAAVTGVFGVPPDQLWRLTRVGEELCAIDALMTIVDKEMRRARGDAGTEVADKVGTVRRQNLEALAEVRIRAYGKVLILRSVERPTEQRVYRVAQANWGNSEVFAAGLRSNRLSVASRQSPVARLLVSASVGDTIELPPDRSEWGVVGVLYPDRYEGAALTANYRNFRSLELSAASVVRRAIGDARRTFDNALEDMRRRWRGGTTASVPDLQAIEEEEVVEIQPTEREQLGAHFYTRTTALQEDLLRRPAEGLVVVLGVAGSGKTSVALGRTKYLCDVVEEDEADRFFFPESAIGYVLSDQLAGYLQAASRQLMLNLPIKEYRGLRQELASRRDISAAGIGGLGDAAPGLDGAMSWLRAADVVVAEALVNAVRTAIATPPPARDVRGESSEQQEARRQALANVWGVLVQRVDAALAPLGSSASSTSFRLEGVVRRLDDARARFAKELEATPPWNGPDRREVRQNVRSLVRERLVRALRLPNVYRAVVQEGRFEAELRASAPGEVELDAELGRVRERLARGLASPDVDVILALYDLVAAGYTGRDGRDPISHLEDSDHHSQVFIDEFQDFSEVQLFLMGRQSDPKRRAVTVVGDLLQRLHIGREPRVEQCFPWASSEDVVPAVLTENKRQVRALASFSHEIRRTLLADDATEAGHAIDEPGEVPRILEASDLATAVAAEIAALPRNFSIAVLAASEKGAASIESAIREELTSVFRESRVSRQTELLKRFYVHFTTPTEAKGLEFDAVIIAGAEAFQFEDPVSAHAFYVACSRPRKRLSVVATRLDQRLRDLAERGLATFVCLT